MKNVTCFLVLVLLCFSQPSHGQSTYDSLWHKINKSRLEDRPKQTFELTRQLYELAEKHHNVAQKGRAMTIELETHYMTSLYYDARLTMLERLDEWQSKAVDIEEKAIVHTLQCCLAERDSVKSMLAHAQYIYDYGEELHRASAKDYVPFVILGKDDHLFRHRLYSMLAQIAINCVRNTVSHYDRDITNQSEAVQMISKLYQQWLRFEQTDNQLDASLLVSIQMIRDITLKDNIYNELTKLVDEYKDSNYLIELYIARATDATKMGNKHLALEIAEEGMKRYPHASRVSVLQQLVMNIKRPYLHMSIQRQFMSSDSISVRFTACNVPQVKLEIGDESHLISLPQDTLYNNITKTIKLPPLPYGHYIVNVHPIVDYPDSLCQFKKPRKNEFSVSDMTALTSRVGRSSFYVLALNKLTGKAVPHALVTMYGSGKTRKVKADENGVAFFEEFTHYHSEISIQAPKGHSDQFMYRASTSYGRLSTPTYNPRESIHFTVDRPIYHPGDSVHVRLLAYSKNDIKGHVLAKDSVRINLMNASRKVIDSLRCVTDKHGVAYGTFHLPKGQMNGEFSLRTACRRGYKSFEVADYQQPSFKVDGLPERLDSCFVNTPFVCTMEARQMTGVPLQNAKVSYSVQRELFWRFYHFRYNGSEPQSELFHGEGVTDEQGRFSTTLTVDTTQVFWKADRFKVQYHVVSQSGESQDATQYFTVYGGTEKVSTRPDSITKPIWIKAEKYVFAEDSPAHFAVRVNKPGRQLYMTYAIGDSIVVKHLRKDKTIKSFKKDTKDYDIYNVHLPYVVKMRRGIAPRFILAGEGELDSHSIRVEYIQPDKRLKIRVASFRNHMVPNQRETWRFNITDAKNKPVLATMGLWMYDASLDMLADSYNGWLLDWRPKLASVQLRGTRSYGFNPSGYSYKLPSYTHESWDYDRFMDGWLPTIYKRDPIIVPGGLLSETVVVGYGRMMHKNATRADSSIRIRGVSQKVDVHFVAPEEEGTKNIGQSLRKAPSATAFFYPNLHSDKRGNINVPITAPVDLTTWRVRAQVHTDLLYQGELDTTLVTSKALMIKPLLPRFCRVNDQLELSTQVVNKQKSTSLVTLTWQLFDVETDEILQEKTDKVTLKGESQRTLNWVPKPLKSAGEVGYRVVGKTINAQDGEQHRLLVLDNKVQVKTSIPFILGQKGQASATWSTDMTALDNTGTMAVELSHGLYSVALQQLPSLFATGNENCLYGVMHRYYATLVGQMILERQPALKAWMLDDQKALKLLGKTEANLANTPWERTQQARRELWSTLSLNKETLGLKLDAYRSKLKAMQRSDGRFAWFPGMDGSDFLTVYMLELHAFMHMLLPEQSVDESIEETMKKAFAWYTRRAKDKVKHHKNEQNYGIGFDPYTYLYVWTLYNRQGNQTTAVSEENLPDEVQYIYSHLPKQSIDVSLSNKLEAAIVSLAMGDKSFAQTLMHSLREHTLYRSNTYLLSSAVYLTKMLGNDKELDEVLMHALQTARTQTWYGVGDQARIVYSLLALEDEVSSSFSAQLNMMKKDSGSQKKSEMCRGWKDIDCGIVSETIQAPLMEFQKVEFSNQSEVPLWGVVSTTAVHENKQLSSTSTAGFSVQRSLLVQVREQGVIKWQPATSFKQGDLVRVRLEITAPQAMSLIQITDRYAGALVPKQQTAGFHWGLPGYYLEPKVSQMNCFVHWIRKGKSVITYEMLAQQSGAYRDNGVEIKSCYAPEYTASSDSKAITIE